MLSKRSQEGYLLIDNNLSGGQKLETATITCSHCQRIVVLNPGRTRSRNYCQKCDHYLCDWCDARECLPMNKALDNLQELKIKEIRKGIY